MVGPPLRSRWRAAECRDAALFKVVRTASHAFGELRLYGVFGDVKPGSGVFLRQAVEQPEREHLAAVLGQIAHRGRKHFEFLLLVDRIGGTRTILGNRESGEIVNLIESDYLAAAENIKGGVAGSGKKKRLRITEAPRLAGTDEAGVGLLHEVIDVGQRGKNAAKVAAERGLVGLDFLGEPAGLIGGAGGGGDSRGGVNRRECRCTRKAIEA